MTRTASPCQREAIEGPLGPMLVLAGPGAGKTFCLIERIRFLIERHGFDPARICAITFTNKAAEEIADRLMALGDRARGVRRGTLHSLCVEILREHGEWVGVRRGFGIADEDYQLGVLRRLGVWEKRRGWLLTRFGVHRAQGNPLTAGDLALFHQYRSHLEHRNLIDFDDIVVRTAELFERYEEVAEQVAGRWDYLLVDEFQDLNPRQYEVVRALAKEHRNIFAVGDDEQSIFSWTGADLTLFSVLQNDFGIVKPITLRDNHRCPRQVFDLARSLVRRNPAGLWTRDEIVATHETTHPVRALNFGDEVHEASWLLDDVRGDHERHGLRWGDYAVLYRRHEIGDVLEAELIGAGIPCRLAQGRAVADDPVIAYVVAALKVIADPTDDAHQEEFLRVVLPPSLLDLLRTKVEAGVDGLRAQMEAHARSLPRRAPGATKLWRALYALRNLESLGRKHDDLTALMEELLSQRVGVYRTMLEERHEDLSDPAANPEVVKLAGRLGAALDRGGTVWVESMGGLEIPLRAMLEGAGFARRGVGSSPPDDAEQLRAADVPSLGIALGLFKALQLVATRREAPFGDFTAVDIETTGKDVDKAEVVDLAAVRVRNGKVVGEWSSLVKPRVPIHAAAAAVTGITEAMVANQPHFEEVWPAFREFCGSDVVVAHNGYGFDFPILERMSAPFGAHEFTTYDTLVLARELHPGSRKLQDLAVRFGVDTGQSHRALDDSRTLAQVFLRLDDERIVRSRKTALANMLDQLGIALALWSSPDEGGEVKELRKKSAIYALVRYSDAVEQYRVQRELAGDTSIPAVDDLVERLGGKSLMDRLRTEKSADERYPQAMARLRRLMQRCQSPTLEGQVMEFLELVALSKHDGTSVHQDRVSLLTLHSTKGLEFSRVYIVGVEDAEMPGGTQHRPAMKSEVEEGRRLLYVGMTRAKDRLIMTRCAKRADLPTGGTQFLSEMGLMLEQMTRHGA